MHGNESLHDWSGCRVPTTPQSVNGALSPERWKSPQPVLGGQRELVTGLQPIEQALNPES